MPEIHSICDEVQSDVQGLLKFVFLKNLSPHLRIVHRGNILNYFFKDNLIVPMLEQETSAGGESEA